MYVTLFILGLAFVIMFHEFGHYATAKLFGMKVDKFFLGFGPTLWSFRRGETEYGVKAIPAGGFVRIVGMNRYEEIDPADAGRTFYEQAAWKRAIVLVAGSVTHFLVAVVLLFAALAFVGLPSATIPPTNEIDVVVEDSPAAEAGLQVGDRITAVGGETTGDFPAVRDLLTDRAGETVALDVESAGETRTVEVTLTEREVEGERVGFLGVGPSPIIERMSVGTALGEAVAGDTFSIGRLTTLTLDGLGRVFTPEALSRWFSSIDEPGQRDLEGPVSLVGVGQQVGSLGSSGDFFAVLIIMAQLNIVLGTLNMLPLPPLDGGHLAVLVIEEIVNGIRRLRGRSANWQLDPSVVTPIALAVIVFFVVLSLTALYADIVNPIGDVLQRQ